MGPEQGRGPDGVTERGFFAVLNPEGRDKSQVYLQGAGSPGDPGHPPINYHAYAACCRGGFYREVREIPEETRLVLVLLRRNGLPQALTAVRALRKQNTIVRVSWKESGLHQVGEALADAKRYALFCEICREADGFLASTPELDPLYRQAGCRMGDYLPTPYPVGEPGWDFARPLAERQGIFIGTREFFVPSRNHLLAVAAACRTGERVTVINTDGAAGERLLRAISPDLQVIRGTRPYPEYLRLMAGHRVVFQMDRSAVPGQVAGDALLCGVPCVGGDGAVEREVFSEWCGFGRDAGSVEGLLKDLLQNDTACQRATDLARSAASEKLGFTATKNQLRNWSAADSVSPTNP